MGGEETLKVNHRRKEIRLKARLLRFRDKDTRQIILYIPSLDITGYGADENKAAKMLDYSIQEYFGFLTSLSQKELGNELTRKGWKHTPYANKEYSKAFVSSDGELRNFNAAADEVEQLTVEI